MKLVFSTDLHFQPIYQLHILFFYFSERGHRKYLSKKYGDMYVVLNCNTNAHLDKICEVSKNHILVNNKNITK